MKLKNVFAGVMAAAMLAGALAVPSFAAESIDEENGLFDTYVMMNIPYDEFYAAVGVDNADEIDALSSATKSKTRAGTLAGGSYHVNSDGSDITGVTFPVRVFTPMALGKFKQVTDADSLDITVTLRGTESTTTYTGVDALFENPSYSYYKLDSAPAYYVNGWYNYFTGEMQFGKVKANATTVEGVTVELTQYGRHTDYELVLSGFDIDTSTNDVYGVVLTAADGTEYGLYHVAHIWRGTELGFNGDEDYFAGLIGGTVTKITYYTAEGVYELPVSVDIPAFDAAAKEAAAASRSSSKH